MPSNRTTPPGTVLLSFDIEEFDLPREHGGRITVKRGVEVSSTGLSKILTLLDRTHTTATFFTTGNFASTNPTLTREILSRGHELACHGVDHFAPKKGDITASKQIITNITSSPHKSPKSNSTNILGYRQPRMFPIDYDELAQAGYLYDSSVNPAFIPGRYNHFDIPRHPYYVGPILEIPTSVATPLRIPLFWLSLHLFPLSLYRALAVSSIHSTDYFATYFHPWEFADLTPFREVPRFVKHNSGDRLVSRLESVISDLSRRGCHFSTYSDFAKDYIASHPSGASL